jgi:hypothetical protein
MRKDFEMKYIKLHVLILLLLGFCVHAKRPAVKPELAGGALELIPEKVFKASLWSINNYKKIQKASLKDAGKTPDGAPALQVSLKGKGGGCNIVFPCLAAGGTWRGDKYTAMVIWVKGRAKRDHIEFFIYTTDGQRFSWRVPVKEDWQKIELKKDLAYNRKGFKLNFGKIKGLAFRSMDSAEFEAGGFKLISGGSRLYAKSLQALAIPRLSSAPVLDGRLNEDVWAKACRIADLKLVKSGNQPKEKTEILTFADGEKLYFGVKMYTAKPDRQRANMTVRDSQVYLDDSFEIFINPKLDGKSYEHIVFNQLGTLMDYYHRFDQTKETFIYDYKWNPDVKISVGKSAECWTAELAVPLKDLNIKNGQPFNLQFCRENHTVNEYSCWGLTNRFTEVNNFLLAEISPKKKPLKSVDVEFTLPDKLSVKGAAPVAGSLSLNVVLANPYASAVNSQIALTADSKGNFAFPLKLKSSTSGDYLLTLSGKTFNAEQLLFNLKIPSNVKFGDLLLNPTPKKMKPGKGIFQFSRDVPIVIAPGATVRTKKTARFLRTEIQQNLFGIHPQLTDSNVPGAKFKLMLRKDFKINDNDLKNAVEALPADGYVLKVTPQEVLIVGADEAGLYYGVVTLKQLVRNYLLKKHEPAVPCVAIVDWPDLNFRIVNHWTQAFRRLRESKPSLKFYKKFLKEVVAGSKMNCFSMLFDYAFEYDNTAKITSLRGMFTRQEYAEMARFCKEHFITFIPAFQSGGHSSFITNNYKDMQDPDFDHRQVNVLHPKFYDMLFKCYEEILETVPDTKYFCIWHDEWWQRPKKDKKADFRGIPRWKIFADDIIKNHNFFKKRGIKMIMWADMLLKGHNGGPPMNISKALKVIPRDIIMGNWSSRTVPDGAKELHDAGFKVWDIYNQFRVAPAQDIKFIEGFGCVVYTHFWQTFWYSRDRVLPDYSHAPFRAAEYAWNIKRDASLPLGEWRNRYLNCVKALYYFPERKALTLNYRLVDLSSKANMSTKKWFGKPGFAPVVPQGKTDVANIPFCFGGKGNNVVASVNGEEISLPIKSGDYKGLIFLQGTYMDSKMRKELKNRSKYYQFGVPVGEIRIEYADGPSEVVPLRCGMNTLSVTPLASARFMYSTRYTWDIKTASGKDAGLYIYEWTNPHPFRKIKNVIWKGYDNTAIPVLFALTGLR